MIVGLILGILVFERIIWYWYFSDEVLKKLNNLILDVLEEEEADYIQAYGDPSSRTEEIKKIKAVLG